MKREILEAQHTKEGMIGKIIIIDTRTDPNLPQITIIIIPETIKIGTEIMGKIEIMETIKIVIITIGETKE